MKLSKLLEGLKCEVTRGNSKALINPEDVEITEVVNDNRKISEGSLFICIKGRNIYSALILLEISRKMR